MKDKVKTKKGTKKSFYDVEAPMTAVKVSLYGASAEEFDGRVVTLDLTKSLRGKNLDLRMKVKCENGKLFAELISIKLAGSYIRRSMRRGTDYVEDSFTVECRDAVVVIKPFLITRMRVSRAVRKALREAVKKYVLAYVKIRDSKELFSEIMSNKLQRGMALKLKKIYPLALCEIRVFEIKERKIEEEKEDKVEEEKKISKKDEGDLEVKEK